MAGKKGSKHYPQELKLEAVAGDWTSLPIERVEKEENVMLGSKLVGIYLCRENKYATKNGYHQHYLTTLAIPIIILIR